MLLNWKMNDRVYPTNNSKLYVLDPDDSVWIASAIAVRTAGQASRPSLYWIRSSIIAKKWKKLFWCVVNRQENSGYGLTMNNICRHTADWCKAEANDIHHVRFFYYLLMFDIGGAWPTPDGTCCNKNGGLFCAVALMHNADHCSDINTGPTMKFITCMVLYSYCFMRAVIICSAIHLEPKIGSLYAVEY